jgi:uncharacterized protein YprB with RNaseH-like and TPR domain
MDPLLNRLKALGVNIKSGKDLNDEVKPAGYPIESVISGENRATIYGDTFVTVKHYGFDYRHGSLNLFDIPSLKMISEWGKASGLSELAAPQIAFLDTETSGLAGGTGTFAFLVGLGCYTPTGFDVVQFFMRDPSQEQAMLAALSEWLTPFLVLVTFNGKSFDLPLLNTRYTLNGLTSPFTQFTHIDLLHLARRLWRDRLPSRALGDLEREFAGFSRDQDEVPGYLIPQYYFEYLRTKDARPLGGVLYHNVVDIASLAALFTFTADLIANPDKAEIHALDLAAIARLYEDLGHLEKAAALYERCLIEGLPEENYIRTLERFAIFRKREGHPELAAQLWEYAAEKKYLPAFIEIAKHYEHILSDPDQAAEWVHKAIALVNSQPLPGYLRKMRIEELTHRLERLDKKRIKAQTTAYNQISGTTQDESQPAKNESSE